jgi:hypothetical protein
VITNDGLNKLANEIENCIDHGTYTVDGQKKDTPIYKVSVDGNKIRIFLYLDETEGIGTLSEFELIDEDGDVFAEKADSIEKGDLKGLLVAFDFNIQEV